MSKNTEIIRVNFEQTDRKYYRIPSDLSHAESVDLLNSKLPSDWMGYETEGVNTGFWKPENITDITKIRKDSASHLKTPK